MARRAKKGQCTYCLEWRPVTRDHVPPRSLFAPPRPQLITVPCCEECRVGLGKDDDYATGIMAVRIETGTNPDARARATNFIRGLGRPEQRRELRRLRASSREIQLRSPAGLHLGTSGMFSVELERLRVVAQRVVRGLWRYHKGWALPAEAAVEAFAMEDLERLDEGSLGAALRIVGGLEGAPFHLVGDGRAFRYCFAPRPSEGPQVSAWVLDFYESSRFLCLTATEEMREAALKRAS